MLNIFLPALLKLRLGLALPFPQVRGVVVAPWECRDAPRNVDSLENPAAVAGVSDSPSGHLSLRLSGALLSEGWAFSVPWSTPSMRLHLDLEYLPMNYMTRTLNTHFHYLCGIHGAWENCREGLLSFLFFFSFVQHLSCLDAWRFLYILYRMPVHPKISLGNNSPYVEHVCSDVWYLHLRFATAAGGGAGQHGHEQDHHCGRTSQQYHDQLRMRKQRKSVRKERTLTDEG